MDKQLRFETDDYNYYVNVSDIKIIAFKNDGNSCVIFYKSDERTTEYDNFIPSAEFEYVTFINNDKRILTLLKHEESNANI